MLLYQPIPGELNQEKLWSVNIMNTGEPIQAYLRGVIYESNDGLVFSAETDIFQVPTGKSVKSAANIKINNQWTSTRYEAFGIPSALVPEGDYNYKLILISKTETTATTANIPVWQPGAPRILTPRCGISISDSCPLFSWSAPQPSPRKLITYNFSMFEMLPNQTRHAAVDSNRPWYMQNNIVTTTLTYPSFAKKLKPETWYSYQVYAYAGKQKLQPSEVRMFLYDTTTIKLYVTEPIFLPDSTYRVFPPDNPSLCTLVVPEGWKYIGTTRRGGNSLLCNKVSENCECCTSSGEAGEGYGCSFTNNNCTGKCGTGAVRAECCITYKYPGCVSNDRYISGGFFKESGTVHLATAKEVNRLSLDFTELYNLPEISESASIFLRRIYGTEPRPTFVKKSNYLEPPAGYVLAIANVAGRAVPISIPITKISKNASQRISVDRGRIYVTGVIGNVSLKQRMSKTRAMMWGSVSSDLIDRDLMLIGYYVTNNISGTGPLERISEPLLLKFYRF